MEKSGLLDVSEHRRWRDRGGWKVEEETQGALSR